MGILFGGPRNKDFSILGLYWGTPILGNYHLGNNAKDTENLGFRMVRDLGIGVGI